MQLRSFLLGTLFAAGLIGTAQATILTIPKETALHSYSELPRPTHVVRFYGLPERFNDATVHVVLTVDAEGNPTEISSLKRLPRDLTDRIYPALEKWKFSPARDKNGTPVPMQVVLPLHLVGIR